MGNQTPMKPKPQSLVPGVVWMKQMLPIGLAFVLIAFAGGAYILSQQDSNPAKNMCPLMICQYGCNDSKCISPTPTVDNQKLKSACEQQEGVWRVKYNECESMPSDKGLDAQQCESLGGEFNGCDSACRHNSEKNAPCPAVCVKVCKF